MNKHIYLTALCATMLFALPSCDKTENAKPEDPTGTVTIVLNYTVSPQTYVILYQGPDLHAQTSEPRYCQSLFRILDASMNFSFTSIFALDPNIIEYLIISNGMGGEVADIGEVDGLGEVTDIPSNGWAISSAALVGHGYVVRYRAAYDYPAATELPYMYARVYVDSYITNVYGGIIGATVKYQLPFVP